jgi:hypothetical protein
MPHCCFPRPAIHASCSIPDWWKSAARDLSAVRCDCANDSFSVMPSLMYQTHQASAGCKMNRIPQHPRPAPWLRSCESFSQYIQEFLRLGLSARFIFSFFSVTTAPEDTSELFAEGREMMELLNNNLVLDLTLLVIGLVGLVLAFGWGNWSLAFHRHFPKQRLLSLEEEARQIAKDFADTISQERQRRDAESAREWDARLTGAEVLRSMYSQDQRYLNKHMMETASIVRRLQDIGYWNPTGHYHGIGTAGA